MSSKNKLWGARFAKQASEILEEFNASISFDYKMYREDIRGSIAHSSMLAKQGIISEDDKVKIHEGLYKIQVEIEEDPVGWASVRISDEDIHLAIERRLTEIIGDSAKKLHTARSRNDQVVTDLRLWLKSQGAEFKLKLSELRDAFIFRAEKDIDCILPGYTHLQQAQAISLGHFWLAHEARFNRDTDRLNDCINRLDVNPLGSGALAGTSFNIDRFMTTRELGFNRPSENSLDAVSDRDFVVEFEFVLSMIMVHLSQFAEEMIVWNSQEFGFIRIPDDYATGSSMMPQKKNPDIPELLRGKAGRVIGVMNAMLVTLKGLNLSYNKDLQEDKEQLFMVVDQVLKCLQISINFVKELQPNKDKMLEAVTNSFVNATDAADYLVRKGVPFREAYGVIGEAVKYSIDNDKFLHDLSLVEWQNLHSLIENSLVDLLKPEKGVDSRNIIGGTGREQVKEAIQFAKNRLKGSGIEV